MSQIKDDLVCEIIRLSQTNFLEKRRSQELGEAGEQKVIEWIRKNAASYREEFMVRLEVFSATELGGILKMVTGSGMDLSEILEAHSYTPSPTRPSP